MNRLAELLRELKNHVGETYSTLDKGSTGKNIRHDANALAKTLKSSFPMLEKDPQYVGTEDLINSGFGVMPGIVSPKVANTLRIKNSIQRSPLLDEAVANTPGARIDDDGLFMKIIRHQKPEQAMETSTRGGVFYLPEGSSNAKYYKGESSKYSGYGGNEKISGETLLKNPLFVKGATGGKVPESAYDKLLGKGAYQNMRKDALHYGYSPQDIQEEAIYKFLSQYAPSLEDNAYYIMNNSRFGNQLAYALQEAAVGHEVRKAGFDSVLGYSKGKKGNFLSELFDVRESHYPGAGIDDYQLWPELYKK